MNVVLIGLRGTGKSTCGRLLAGQLGWSFVDTDEVVVEHAGKSIGEIFEEGGESLFRQLECEAVKQAARHLDTVIATGGGAILDSENVTDLRRQGFVIHLSANPRELWRRIEADTRARKHRPQLLGNQLNGEKELEALLLQRSAAYAEARDAELRVDERTPEQVVEAILLLLRARGQLKR